MTDDLICEINQVFSFSQHRNSYHDWRNDTRASAAIRYMEIPIKENIFEVPVFALSQFLAAADKELDLGKEAIIVQILSIGMTSRYKSVERVMQDLLNESYRAKLVEVSIKNGSEYKTYYFTAGAVFDTDYNPIMLCSWQIERIYRRNKRMYRFVKPIIWMDSEEYLDKTLKMNKFLSEKMIPHMLRDKVSQIATAHNWSIPSPAGLTCPKVVIDECPFHFKQTALPSISVTNESLLKLAEDHIEEIIRV